MREHILSEIRRLAAANRGCAPGATALKTFQNHFASQAEMLAEFRKWLAANPGYQDVEAMMPGEPEESSAVRRETVVEGLVYLIRSGVFYKIGRSDQLERRVKEIRLSLPEAATMVHAIRTDDPAGIEAYWHRRFADKRANGEWFKLAAADLAAFKRRKYQ